MKKQPQTPPPYNFGAASSRDRFIYGCGRPGHTHPEINTPRTPRGPPVKESSLKKWIDFLRTRNIQHIICLLSNSELDFFSKPFLKTCVESGFKVTHVPPNDSDAFRKAILVMTQAEKDSQRVVVHCASGQKRTGDVLALWLHRRYCIPVEKAVKEIEDFSKAHRLIRRPSAGGVLALLAPKTLRATPPMPPSWSVSPTKTPRSPVSARTDSRSFHVTVFQMGGEIDKQYESGKVFYGEPAALRIFQSLPFVGLTYDVRTVCRKDGARVESSDRDRLADACVKVKSAKILITHGVQGAIETALSLRRVESLGSKTIVVTGSITPDCMKKSDATFNIGVALGALNVLRRGVFICMNGRIFESSRCEYDNSTKTFVSSKK